MRVRATIAAALAALAVGAGSVLVATPAEAVPGSAARPLPSFAPLVLSGPVATPAPEALGAAFGPTPAPVAVGDTAALPVPDARPRTRQPAPRVGVVVKPTPPPRVRTRHGISGNASWYCRAGVSPCMAIHPDGRGADMYAAAGPALRRAICGSEKSNCWRGRTVLVNGVAVRLADWCQCYKGQRHEKVIDLYWDAWVRVPGVERGVTVRW